MTLKSRYRRVLSHYSLLFIQLPIILVVTSSYSATLLGREVNESGVSNYVLFDLEVNRFFFVMFASAGSV